MDIEIRLDVEEVREWLRQYVGSGWPVLSHAEHRFHSDRYPEEFHSVGMGGIALGCLGEIDEASPQRLLEIIDVLGVSDQIVRDLT